MKLVTPENKVGAPEPGRRLRQLADREARILEAKEAAERRALRVKGVASSVLKQVELATVTLNRPAAQVRDILDRLSPRDLEIHLLAESLGKNRVSVLQGYPKPSAAVVEAYELESGPESPSADSE